MNTLQSMPQMKIAWGGDKTLELALKKQHIDIEFILDNSQAKWGSSFLGLEIKAPTALEDLDKTQYVIVIFSLHYPSITKQLKTLGWTPGVNVFYFRDFNEYTSSQQIDVAKQAYKMQHEWMTKFDTDQSREKHSQTWFDSSTVDAWRHWRMYQLLDPFLDWNATARWLTIGDGRYGTDANYIARKVPDVTATDITEALLKKANQKGFISKFKAENAENLSFEDNSIDLIYCKEALHHVPRPFIALYEMLRVARKGIILLEPADKKMAMPFIGKMVVMCKSFLSQLGLCAAPYDHEFEGSENYLYTLSLREAEKVGISLNCKQLIYKHLNDSYAAGVENEKILDKGPLKAKITKEISRRNFLCKLRIRPYDLVFCAIFHEALPRDQVLELEQNGYSVISLPQNPHLMYAALSSSNESPGI